MRHASLICIALGALASIEGSAQSSPKVETGIANSGTLTIKGDVSINVKVESRVDDLVALLEGRAVKIRQYLVKTHGAKAQELIRQFDDLHQRHIALLKEGKLVAAHEVLSSIHELSFLADEAAHDRFRPSYFCSAPHFIRGDLILIYVTGDDSSEKYPITEQELRINSRRSGCGPSLRMASPLDLQTTYLTILDER